MEWDSPTLNATGMSNAATNGTNATMALQAVNATETDKMVKQGNTTFNFTGTSGISSFNYRAQLVKPTGALTAGVFNASANYIIAYK